MLLLCVCMVTKAQLIQGGGPVVESYNAENNDIQLLSNDDDNFVVYMAPKVDKSKFYHHQILKYDKQSNTFSSKPLTLPAKNFCLLSFDAGDQYFAVYGCYPKNTQYEYRVAKFSKSFDAEKVTPELRFSMPVKYFGDVREYAATSADGKYHAVVLFSVNPNYKVGAFHCFLYDEQGNEVFYRSLKPEIYGGTFSVEDLIVDNQGVVYLLMADGQQQNNFWESSAVHLLKITEDKAEARAIPFQDGIIHSMKMLALKNNNLFIGGYFANKDHQPTCGYFSVVFDTKINDFAALKKEDFSADQRPGIEQVLYIRAPYHTECKDIYQLENGNVVMLGENTCMVIKEDNGTTTYWYHKQNILCQHFDENGTVMAEHILMKNQNIGSQWMLFERECNGMNALGIGLSFSSFVKGNDVYVLYTDSKSHIPTQPSPAAVNVVLGRAKNCLNISKLSETNIMTRPVMDYAQSKNTFNRLWLFDGRNAYFGMYNLKGYTLEKLEIE